MMIVVQGKVFPCCGCNTPIKCFVIIVALVGEVVALVVLCDDTSFNLLMLLKFVVVRVEVVVVSVDGVACETLPDSVLFPFKLSASLLDTLTYCFRALCMGKWHD